MELAPSVAQRYQEFSVRCTPGFLFEALRLTTACEASYKQSGNPRLLIEFTLMSLCNISFAITGQQQAVAPQPTAAQPRPAAAQPQQAAVPPQPAAQPQPAQPQPLASQPAAPTQTPQPSQPAPSQPAPSQPQPSHKPTGLSLKAMLEDARKETPAQAVAPQGAPVEKPAPDAERLSAVWQALAASEVRMPRLSSAIAQATPTLEGKVVHFEVGNVAQQEWIDRNCRARMEAFLQNRFEDPAIRLVIDVKKAEETGRGMYMPSDKAKFLQETSPEYNGLQKDLGLEIS